MVCVSRQVCQTCVSQRARSSEVLQIKEKWKVQAFLHRSVVNGEAHLELAESRFGPKSHKSLFIDEVILFRVPPVR